MVRYLDYVEFLDLVKNCEVTMNFRDVKNNELDELFKTFDKNNTLIKKQIGLRVPNSYKGEVITTIDFGKLEKGDIILIINNRNHYLSVVEEVLYNEIQIM
jgi:hypothetical protein